MTHCTSFHVLTAESADRGDRSEPAPPLDPDAPVSETLRRIIGALLQVARTHEAGIRADADPECLHDYRVSLRKARSMLGLYPGPDRQSEADWLSHALAAMMQATNRLRDLDVYLLTQDQVFARIPATLHEGLRIMFAALHQERAARHVRVATMLASEAYADTMRDVTARFRPAHRLATGPDADEPTLPFARRVIRQRYRKVGKLVRRITADTPDHELHRLRIRCKKLRYALECFAPLFPDHAVKLPLKALKQAQARLGACNDCVVQQRSLQQFWQEYAASHPAAPKLAESIAALVTMLRQDQMAERDRIPTTLAAFDHPDIRAGFAALGSKHVRS